MVKIRLRRVGSKKQPSFRVVIADSRAPRDGRFIEEIGFYNPRTEPETLRIDEARALYWLSVGAQPTDSARRLLTTLGTLQRFERLRQGESLEELVAEAEMAKEEEEEEATEAPSAAAPQELDEEIDEAEAEDVGTEETMPEAEVEAESEEEAPQEIDEAEEDESED